MKCVMDTEIPLPREDGIYQIGCPRIHHHVFTSFTGVFHQIG